MSRYDELLELLQFELIFTSKTSDGTGLDNLAIHEIDNVHACDDILA